MGARLMDTTTTKAVAIKANELSSKLFRLVNEIKDLQVQARSGRAISCEHEGELDAVACRLADVYAKFHDSDLIAECFRDL
jgi:hypothetical protein